jgi:hypothetical protein
MMTVEQVGAWTLALAACVEMGSFLATELASVCRTNDEAVLDFVRSRLVVLGSNGTALLTHPATLARRSKRVRTINAGVCAGAHDHARGGVGGVHEEEVRKETERTRKPSELEMRLEQQIANARAALSDEGFVHVGKVMDALAHTKRGKMLPLSARIEMWEQAASVPWAQFAIGCYTFSVDGPLASGKGFRYLMGIVRGSALTQYVEERAEWEKQHGFALEGL